VKVVERTSEHRIRQEIEVDDMQFGFVKGKGTSDAIFTVRQIVSDIAMFVLKRDIKLQLTHCKTDAGEF